MDLITTIQEELQSIIKEGYVFNDENQHFSFTQLIENPSFFNYESFSSEHDVDITESQIYVHWKTGFWLNKMGIENLTIDIQGVEGQYKLEFYHKQSDELIQETSKDIKEIDWNFVVDDASLSKGGSLYVQDLTFDFKTNTCTVSF